MPHVKYTSDVWHMRRLARLYQFPHFRSQGQHFREPHLQILTCFAPFWPLHYVSLSQVHGAPWPFWCLLRLYRSPLLV